MLPESSSLHDDVLAALRAARPLDFGSALDVAMGVLADKPTEALEFREWYKSNGATLVRIINDGR